MTGERTGSAVGLGFKVSVSDVFARKPEYGRRRNLMLRLTE